MEDTRAKLFVLLTLFFLSLIISRPAIALQYNTVSYPRVSANYLDEGKRQGLNYLGHVVDWSPADKENSYAFIWEDGVMTDHLSPHSTWHMYQSLYPNNLGQIIEPGRYDGEDSNYILMALPDFPHESAPPEPISEPTQEPFAMLLVSILVLLLWWDSERNIPPPQNLWRVRSAKRP